VIGRTVSMIPVQPVSRAKKRKTPRNSTWLTAAPSSQVNNEKVAEQTFSQNRCTGLKACCRNRLEIRRPTRWRMSRFFSCSAPPIRSSTGLKFVVNSRMAQQGSLAAPCAEPGGAAVPQSVSHFRVNLVCCRYSCLFTIAQVGSQTSHNANSANLPQHPP
jgi:hypothetical protein